MRRPGVGMSSKARWLVTASLSVLLVVIAAVGMSTVGGAGENRPDWRAALADSCASLWVTTRDDLRVSGAPDGEARRHADLAREKCEEPLVGSRESPRAAAPCADDTNRRNAPGARRADVASVYFSCMANVGAQGQPVYRFTRRVVDTSDAAIRLEAALRAYLQGPTRAEKQLGYMTAVPTPFGDALQGVSVQGRRAIVSFTPALEARVGALPTAAADAFLLELKTTVFESGDIQQLDLDIAGECERFWRLLEGRGSCVTLERGA